MAKGDAFWTAQERKASLKEAEAAGQVADSMDVRKTLMQRVHSGEITLEHAQAELRKIKRNAKASGKVTRNQAFLGRIP
ncbi:hypothetical protein [Luteimonas saliphila]|uniref:hypothetical protein n=1 Tax=Luteimonas saliphila TaxID=2804919 RepID=UPI00192E1451|nr:hypothetical protein [Luteimonas saliphila]